MKANHVLAKATIVAVAVAMAGCASTQSTLNQANANATTMSDRVMSATRSASEKMFDVQLERDIKVALASVPEVANKQARVMVDVFRGYVLLTGEAPTKEALDRVVSVVNSVPSVTTGTNAIEIMPPKLTTHTLNEKYLKTKVAHNMKRIGINSNESELVVRNDVVYLMGVPNSQRDMAMRSMLNQMGGIHAYKEIDITPKATQSATQATTTQASTRPATQPTTQTSAYPQSQYTGQPVYTYPQNNTVNQGYAYSNASVPPSTYGQVYNNQHYAGQNYGNYSYVDNASSKGYRYTVPNPAQSDYVRKWKNPRWAP